MCLNFVFWSWMFVVQYVELPCMGEYLLCAHGPLDLIFHDHWHLWQLDGGQLREEPGSLAGADVGDGGGDDGGDVGCSDHDYEYYYDYDGDEVPVIAGSALCEIENTDPELGREKISSA